MSSYDESFFKYLNSGSLKSAEIVIPLVKKYFDLSSVLDIGCGQGAWLSIWEREGVADIYGIDGDYVNQQDLLIKSEQFYPYDLNKELNLNRRFDLVQCLEVAEHISEEKSGLLIENLVRHSDMILFSSAPKGQGGDNHINEQSYEFWRKIFFSYGYVACDIIRPLISEFSDVEPWYRYNTLIYVSKDKLQLLDNDIKISKVSDDIEITDLSPLHYQIRKTLLKYFPIIVITKLAKLKERVIFFIRSL